MRYIFDTLSKDVHILLAIDPIFIASCIKLETECLRVLIMRVWNVDSKLRVEHKIAKTMRPEERKA